MTQVTVQVSPTKSVTVKVREFLGNRDDLLAGFAQEHKGHNIVVHSCTKFSQNFNEFTEQEDGSFAQEVAEDYVTSYEIAECTTCNETFDVANTYFKVDGKDYSDGFFGSI